MLRQKQSKTKTTKTPSKPAAKMETVKTAAKVEKSQPAKAKSLTSKTTAKVEKSQPAKAKSLTSKTTAKVEKSQPAKAKSTPSKATTKMEKSPSVKVQVKPEDRTRLLLFLWDMGNKEVSKGELTEKLKKGKETATMYQPVFEKLDKDGAITISTKGNAAKVSMMDKGMQMLQDGLKNPEFKFDGDRVGSDVANALLKWIGSLDKAATPKKETSKNKKVK
jgi:chemotaxis protein histidine kinase CheA